MSFRPLVALALLATGCATAPVMPTEPQVAASTGDMDPSRLPLGATTSDMAVVQGSERRPVGTATSSTERAALHGRPVLRVTLTQEVNGGTMTDTLDVDPATLRPLRYRNAFGDRQSIRVDYEPDGRVRSTVVRSGVTTTLDTTLTGPHFDAAELQPLIAALPLEEGYAAEIPVFHYERGAETARVHVIGRGTAVRGGAGRPVWVVEYTAGPAPTVILEIDRETRRTLMVTAVSSPSTRFEQVAR